MADLNLKAGDRVLVEFTILNPKPDIDGDVTLRGVHGYTAWAPFDHIHSKLYTPIEEPQTIGSVVRTPSGTRYTRYTESLLIDLPWVSDDPNADEFYEWAEIISLEPELVK